MKTLPTVLLLISFLHASIVCAADGDLKAAFDALQQRHAEALTAASAETTGSVEDAWFLDLKKLRLDAVAKSDTQTAKKIEAMLLAAGRNGVSLPAAAAPVASVPEEKKMGLPEKGSRWDGFSKVHWSNNSETGGGFIEGKVTSVKESTFVLRTSADSGQIWDWTFKLEGNEIEMIKFDRIRAATGLGKLNPAVGITGNGKLENGAMTFSFSWPQPGFVFMGTFDLKLVK